MRKTTATIAITCALGFIGAASSSATGNCPQPSHTTTHPKPCPTTTTTPETTTTVVVTTTTAPTTTTTAPEPNVTIPPTTTTTIPVFEPTFAG